MKLNPRIWKPIAWFLCLFNVVGSVIAYRAAEMSHTALHVVLAIAFGAWAWWGFRRGVAV